MSTSVITVAQSLLGGQWIGAQEVNETLFPPRQLEVKDALARVQQPPPWHAEVAYFDETVDEWVL